MTSASMNVTMTTTVEAAATCTSELRASFTPVFLNLCETAAW